MSARAQRGLGRTFQTALLFPELTVRETIQVALEARGRTPFVATALGLPGPGAASGRVVRTPTIWCRSSVWVAMPTPT